MSRQHLYSTEDISGISGEMTEIINPIKNKSKKSVSSASIDVQAGFLSIFQPATGVAEPCEKIPAQDIPYPSAAAYSGGDMAEPKPKAPKKPVARGRSCQWCERDHSLGLPMRQCYLCGFRICPDCLPLHHGVHNREGGDKCSKCLYGYLLPD